MSTDRRMIAQSRRRRVIYQTSLEEGPETAAERRAAERLREARRPTAHYGSHVRRRLRGRWFSLVPVNPLAMTGYGGLILGIALLLCVMHYLSVTWSPLALREDLARPFRLDRPDSFGTYTRAIFLFAAAGTALLIYQLRRYKVDDYKGHYRLWRPVILLLVLLSIDSACGLVPWTGAVIDAAIGQRVAMAGANWLRIVMAVGGIVLAVRLLAEVRRSRLSLALMSVAVACWCAPLLGYWKLYQVDGFRGWMTITTTPLIAAATFWVATGAYLRMLFRDVRGLNQITEDSAVEPVKRSQRRSTDDELADDEPRGWFGWFRKSKPEAGEPADAPEKRRKRMAVVRQDEERSDDRVDTSQTAKSNHAAAPKRRWLGLRGAAKEEPKPAAKAAPAKEPASPSDQTGKPKRSWLGFRKSAGAAAEPETKPVSKPAATAAAKDAAAPTPAKKSGLGGWLSRGKAADGETTAASANRGPAAPTGVKSSATTVNKPAQSAAYASSDDNSDDYDEDEGESSSMSKAERRRLRKEARRNGRAA